MARDVTSNKLILLILSGDDGAFTLSADPCSFLDRAYIHVLSSILIDHFPLFLDKLGRLLVFVLLDGFGERSVENQFARDGQRSNGFMFVG